MFKNSNSVTPTENSAYPPITDYTISKPSTWSLTSHPSLQPWQRIHYSWHREPRPEHRIAEGNTLFVNRGCIMQQVAWSNFRCMPHAVRSWESQHCRLQGHIPCHGGTTHHLCLLCQCALPPFHSSYSLSLHLSTLHSWLIYCLERSFLSDLGCTVSYLA